ncbi:MAG: alpha-hydroxy-acid oxidizing protein [Candidatus Eremiobacteraeota bacterium]|nr:alpha-hydroxy-acid oxidizing protein [Candidatus Eremiobacteraeota bacterium]
MEIASTQRAVNIADYERLANEKLDANANAYIFGGSGDEVTLRDNVAAFQRYKLRSRVLAGVGRVSTATRVLGTSIALPVIVAPVAVQRLAHPEGEEATARAAAAADTIMCLSSAATCPPRGIPNGKRWFQVYVWNTRSKTTAAIEEAVACGYSALVLTVDVPYFGNRERDVRVGFKIPEDLTVEGELLGTGFDATLTWGDVEWLASYGLPVVIKGIMTAEDAALACEHGAAAIVVSNHGGRQLDGASATIDVLEEVVHAVDGRAEVMLDGGIRRGTDVVKALALGARAVMIGRPMLWGLAADGQSGVAEVLRILQEEIRLTLALLGCKSPANVTRAHVR